MNFITCNNENTNTDTNTFTNSNLQQWNAETKDQMCEYFSTFKSQVSRCYLRLMVMSLHKPCYWLTALERLWTVEQILAFSLASCRAHIHGKPFSDGARYSAQWFSLGEPGTHMRGNPREGNTVHNGCRAQRLQHMFPGTSLNIDAQRQEHM